jgi:hypothetical protein
VGPRPRLCERAENGLRTHCELFPNVHARHTLQVQVRNPSSNLNAASGYTQKAFDLSAYKGQTIQIYLLGQEDASLQTSFVVDDFALNVQ